MVASPPVFDPVPALDSLLFALKTAKLDDPAFLRDLGELEQRRKATGMSDRQAWRAVYGAAIAVGARAIAVQEAIDREAKAAKERAVAAQKLRQAASSVEAALGREQGEWASRLSKQTRELEDKVSRSVATLSVAGVVDEATGETVYGIPPAEAEAFLGWLRNTIDDWRAHDGSLTATRANEALEAAAGDAMGAFRVAAPDLAIASASALVLPTQRFPGKGKFEALSGTYKFVMSGVMGASSVGFVVSRLQLGGPTMTSALAVLSGVVLGAALVAAAVTVPKQHRQALARERARATESVRAAAEKAVREQLARASAMLGDAIKKHLLAEGRRFAKMVREATSGAPENAMPSMKGLMPQDVTRIQGEWRQAIEKRLAEM